MKRTIVGIVVIAALAIAVGLRAQQESKKTSGSGSLGDGLKIEEVWQRVK
jgi:hypothetical protein